MQDAGLGFPILMDAVKPQSPGQGNSPFLKPKEHAFITQLTGMAKNKRPGYSPRNAGDRRQSTGRQTCLSRL